MGLIPSPALRGARKRVFLGGLPRYAKKAGALDGLVKQLQSPSAFGGRRSVVSAQPFRVNPQQGHHEAASGAAGLGPGPLCPPSSLVTRGLPGRRPSATAARVPRKLSCIA